MYCPIIVLNSFFCLGSLLFSLPHFVADDYTGSLTGGSSAVSLCNQPVTCSAKPQVKDKLVVDLQLL